MSFDLLLAERGQKTARAATGTESSRIRTAGRAELRGGFARSASFG
jgi:hypothetical protein